MLVVSGADLVGKSTFCAKVLKILQEDYKLPHMLHHLSRPPASFDYYQDYVDILSVYSVWDRFHLDSLAYRACDDHPSRMTPLKFAMTEAQFRLNCGYQVVLYTDQHVLQNRYDLKGDPMYSIEHIKRVNEKFVEMCYKRDDHFVVRGQGYSPRIDMYGESTDSMIECVVESYVARLKEFSAITQDMRLMANFNLK